MQPEISVVICTYNRPKPLADALATLVQQQVDLRQFEVIVVENSSTPDQTERLVADYQPVLANLRAIREPQTGLSFARNRGWRAAQGAYVAYVDDDCKFPPQWLSVATQIIQERQPAIFGGPFFAYYDRPKAIWYRDAYGSRHFGGLSRYLEKDETLFGGNLFVEKSYLQALGGFAVDLGMSGQQIAYGEDTTFQQRFRKRHPDIGIYYDPALFVLHLVRCEKISLVWSARSFVAKGRYIQLQEVNSVAAPIGLVRALIKAAKLGVGMATDMTYGLLTRDRSRYPHYQNYLYEHTGQYWRGIGRLSAQIGRQGAQQHPQRVA